MKMDPRQLVQDLKDELIGSFAQKMSQVETQSGSSNDATIAAMRASMQRERESTVSEVKQMMQQLQLQLQQHYDDNIARLSAEAKVREAELLAEANAAKQEGNRDQVGQDFHGTYFSRRAFKDTVIDDRLIAKAAAKGVARPTSANGTAMTL
jgi:hypothetical protein